MTTEAERKEQSRLNRALRAGMIRQIIEMSKAGHTYAQIGARIHRSETAVSHVMIRNGFRQRTIGIVKPPHRYHTRSCATCAKAFRVRKDAATTHCKACTEHLFRFKPGTVPPNKGITPGRIDRKCKTCGEFFSYNRKNLDRRPNYKWGSYCCRECYGIAQQDPDARYSEVGKNYPSRRFGRKRC